MGSPARPAACPSGRQNDLAQAAALGKQATREVDARWSPDGRAATVPRHRVTSRRQHAVDQRRDEPVSGRKVRTLLDEVRNPGSGQVRLESAGLASGVYLVRLRAAGKSQIRRVTLMR